MKLDVLSFRSKSKAAIITLLQEIDRGFSQMAGRGLSLFVAEGLDRIEPGRLTGGDVPEENAYGR